MVFTFKSVLPKTERFFIVMKCVTCLTAFNDESPPRHFMTRRTDLAGLIGKRSCVTFLIRLKCYYEKAHTGV